MKKLLIFQFFIISNVISAQNGVVSTVPRLIRNHENKPVMSWVEKEGENFNFYFKTSEDEGKTFGEKRLIASGKDISAHAEGMPKIAFKSDGTIIATSEVKRVTKDAPRASSIQYRMSNDGGKTWSKPTYIHADTSAGKGHSFHDILTLPNGEIAAAWLDDKMEGDGRSVRFAQTTRGGGFGAEMVVDKNACQCCRTALYADNQGVIYLTFRDLLADGSRDMGIVSSKDGGLTFSKTTLVYADKWVVNACPHTGPAMSQIGVDMYVAWYSGADKNEGVRLAKLGDDKLTLKLPTDTFHPQLNTLKSGDLALVYEEWVSKKEVNLKRINLSIISPNKKVKKVAISSDDETATFPVIIPVKDGILVAYESIIGDGSKQIVSKVVSL
jgi:hypothetical protein